ncbi:MAG: hypothetical protein KYQ20_02515, partial [Candidatus Nealsonbacteria bacterium]|nr:hypothetical protein [Candidatus Nealsonbacteria bacterium]
MNNQASNQSPKLPFFYRQLPIILGVIIVIFIAGGVFAWHYFRMPAKEEVKPSQEIVPAAEEVKAPEQEAALEVNKFTKEKLPRFEDFLVLERFEGAPAPVDLLSHPKAMRFRTVLREGAKKGPNFAGHYTIVTWGCSTACAVIAVVNAKTGAVYFGPIANAGTEFRIDSNLFIKNPIKGPMFY